MKNGLASKMRDNSNDLCWVKYLKRVQFEKNTTFHSTVGMTPYEAVYHHKPSYGLSDFGIPVEYGSEIHTEQELDALIEEINGPISKITSQLCLLIISHHLRSINCRNPDQQL